MYSEQKEALGPGDRAQAPGGAGRQRPAQQRQDDAAGKASACPAQPGGLKVGIIKHDGHDFNPRCPRHRQLPPAGSGAEGVAVYSGQRYLLTEMFRLTEQDLLALFERHGYDLVLLEGFKDSGWPKIEVVRKEISDTPVSFQPLAVVGDIPGQILDWKMRRLWPTGSLPRCQACKEKTDMKLIRTEDAAGQVLCHDITQIIPGEFKGARFRKGHVIQPEDIPVLLSIGKENLYVWEKKPGILHEDEAAALLYRAAAGRNIHGTEPKEGKIELIADCDGLLKIDRAALLAVNRTPQMMIATIHGDMPVKKRSQTGRYPHHPAGHRAGKDGCHAESSGGQAHPERPALPPEEVCGHHHGQRRSSRAASRINSPPSWNASWRNTAARWSSTRSATTTRRALRRPFWKQRRRAAS